jgi:hypothetical protein
MQWIDTLEFFWDSLPDGDKVCQGILGVASIASMPA